MTEPRPPEGAGDATSPWPQWVQRLGTAQRSKAGTLFLVWGNVDDLVAWRGALWRVPELLAQSVFAHRDLVLHYDLSRGLRPFAGRDAARLRTMVPRADRAVGDLATAPHDPASVLALLDRFILKTVVAPASARVSAALLIDHAGYVLPSSGTATTQVGTVLNWAVSPSLRRHDVAVVLLEPDRAAIDARIARHAAVTCLQVPLPDRDARIEGAHSLGVDAAVAEEAAGLRLADLAGLGGEAPADAAIASLRGRYCDGLLGVERPTAGLETLAGHAAVVSRLREDLAAPDRTAGYVVCGAAGTGKTSLTRAVAATLGWPWVHLRPPREGDALAAAAVDRAVAVLHTLGPAVVVLDDAADPAARAFDEVVAEEMARRASVWMLVTRRPDRLPASWRRPGAADEVLPLFDPDDENEVRALLAAHGAPAPGGPLPLLAAREVAEVMRRARRAAARAGCPLDASHVGAALARHLPAGSPLGRERETLSAVLACSDLALLPGSWAGRLSLDPMNARRELEVRAFELDRMVAREWHRWSHHADAPTGINLMP